MFVVYLYIIGKQFQAGLPRTVIETAHGARSTRLNIKQRRKEMNQKYNNKAGEQNDFLWNTLMYASLGFIMLVELALPALVARKVLKHMKGGGQN